MCVNFDRTCYFSNLCCNIFKIEFRMIIHNENVLDLNKMIFNFVFTKGNVWVSNIAFEGSLLI